jgi:hypothetical protein
MSAMTTRRRTRQPGDTLPVRAQLPGPNDRLPVDQPDPDSDGDDTVHGTIPPPPKKPRRTR